MYTDKSKIYKYSIKNNNFKDKNNNIIEREKEREKMFELIVFEISFNHASENSVV